MIYGNAPAWSHRTHRTVVEEDLDFLNSRKATVDVQIEQLQERIRWLHGEEDIVLHRGDLKKAEEIKQAIREREEEREKLADKQAYLAELVQETRAALGNKSSRHSRR